MHKELWSGEDEIVLWGWRVACESMPDLKKNIQMLGDMVIFEEPKRQRLALPGWIAMLANHRTSCVALTILKQEKRYQPIRGWLVCELRPLAALLESDTFSHRTAEYIQKAFEVLTIEEAEFGRGS